MSQGLIKTDRMIPESLVLRIVLVINLLVTAGGMIELPLRKLIRV
jgi:hypothetical protein